MDAPVQLVFFGEVLEGFRLDEVKRRVGQLLKLDEARVAQMFSGRRTVLKRSVAQTEAQRYATVLAKAGARIHIEPNAAAPTVTAAPSATVPAVKTTASGFPVIEPAAIDAPAPPPLDEHVPFARPTPSFAPARPAPAAAGTLKTLELAPLAAAVEEEVTCPNCGERQSKRLLCRSCSTDIAMGIAAKLEAENEARAAKNDALLAQRAMRAGRSVAPAVRAPGVIGLSLQGRMGRLKYAASNIWLLTAMYLLVVLIVQKPSIGRIVFATMAFAVVFYMSVRLMVLRCHDCDKSGWWSMLAFVPSVNAIFSLVLSFARGTDGDNDYGEEPPAGLWRYFVLAGACLSLAVAMTVMSTVRAAVRNAHAETEETSDVVEFDSRSNNLPTPEAREAFNGPYASARNHKAFAVSSGGGWGMSASAGSARDAIQAAIADCEARRASYTPRCIPVNLDGEWGPSKTR
jgi:uncharacterized membrane protein YhaH (DUF805 family)